MLVLGLLLLAGACAVGITGVLANRGAGHQVTGGFDAFGRTMHGSSGQLFFWGIVVGGVALLGVVLLLAGLRSGVRRRARARRSVVQPVRDERGDRHDEAVDGDRTPVSVPTKRERQERDDEEDAAQADLSDSAAAAD